MSTQVLTTIKDGLKAYAPLSDYLQDRYSRQGKHLIGYEMGSASSKDRPGFFYVFAKREYGPKAISSKSYGLIIFQTIEKETTDECQDGVTVCENIMNLVVNYLETQPITGVLFANFELATDFYSQHPYYEIGLKFSFIQDRQRIL